MNQWVEKKKQRKIIKNQSNSKIFFVLIKPNRLSFLKVVNKYFDSEWSFCQFKLPDKNSKVTFLTNQDSDNDKLIAAISPKGQYYIISFENPSQPKVVGTKSFTSKIADNTTSMIGFFPYK